VDPCTIVQFLQWKTQKMQKCYQSFIIPYFKWSLECFGRHTIHYQEPKTVQAASGFAYVEGFVGRAVAGCYQATYLPRIQTQRLLVQF
jgi:hypothetical protein